MEAVRADLAPLSLVSSTVGAMDTAVQVAVPPFLSPVHAALFIKQACCGLLLRIAMDLACKKRTYIRLYAVSINDFA